MLTQPWIIARKEITDGLRDTRALISSALYCLMGPAVVFLVSLSRMANGDRTVLTAMMSVFCLVTAFTGGMNVAIDSIAGERERRSLLPLLLSPVTRFDVVLGKWLSISFFAVAGVALNLVAFGLLFGWHTYLALIALSLAPLAFLAAALELLLSTVCRAIKEAHTYLSLLVFLPMGVGMFMVFCPPAGQFWWRVMPAAGHQLLLQDFMRGEPVALAPAVLLGLATTAAAGLALVAAAERLQRDEVVYGN